MELLRCQAKFNLFLLHQRFDRGRRREHDFEHQIKPEQIQTI